jgi:Domain of unknown function (DUF5668)
MTDLHPWRRNNSGLVLGAAIMVFGITLLLDELGVIDGPGYAVFWPLVVIAIGVGKLSQRGADGRHHGGWWVFFGSWMLLSQLHVLWLRDSWPLFLVALGISMVWKEMRTRARVE